MKKFATIVDSKGNVYDYTISMFPAGEVGLVLPIELESVLDVTIKCDVFTANDLLLLSAMIRNIKNLVAVDIGFLAFQRQDKFKRIKEDKFLEIPVYDYPYEIIKHAIGNRSITVSLLDTHNDLAKDYLSNQVNVVPDITTIVETGLKELNLLSEIDNVVLVFPDEGAMNRYTASNNKFKSMAFTKERNDQGRIVKHDLDGVYILEDIKNKHVFIIDDLCDGGATFLSLASKLNGLPKTQSLYVTHGLFTQGVDKLSSVFDTILYATSPHTKGSLLGCVQVTFN